MFKLIKKCQAQPSKVSRTRAPKSASTAKQEKDGSKRSPLRPLLLVERVLGINSTSPPFQESKQVKRPDLKTSAPAKDPLPRPPARASFYVQNKTSKVDTKKPTTTKPPFKVSFSVPASSYTSRRASLPPTATVPKKPVTPFVVPLHVKRPSTSSKVVGPGAIKSVPSKPHFFTPPSVTASKVISKPRSSLPASLSASKTASQARSSLPISTPQGTAQQSRIPRLRLDKISSTPSTPPKVLSPVSSSSSSNPTSPTTPCPKSTTTASKTKALCFPASANNIEMPTTLEPKPDSAAVLKSVDPSKAPEATLPLTNAVEIVQDAVPVVIGTQNLQNLQTYSTKVTTHLNVDKTSNALVSELKSVLKRVHEANGCTQLDKMTRPVSKESPKVARRVRFAEKENRAELQEVFRWRSMGNSIAGRIPFSSVTPNVESSSLASPGDSSFQLINTPFGTRKVRRVVVPPLEDGAVASQNPQIQLELSALRTQKRVQGGGEKLNCPKDGMSLYSMAIIQKNRKSI